MPRKSYTIEQIISKLREAEVLLVQGQTTGEVYRSFNISEQTYYRGRKEYGGIRTDQVRRLKELKKENARLKNELDKIKGQYDFVIVDCPPALSWLTINAFTAADKVLVEVAPGYFELDSIVQISKTIKEVKEYFNTDLQIMGFLFTMSDPTVNAATSLQIVPCQSI